MKMDFIKKYLHSLSRYDGYIILLVVTLGFGSFMSEFYHQHKHVDWLILPKVSDFFSPGNAYRSCVYTVILLILSTVLRHATNNSKDKSWRYMAVMAFSIVGSVIVALITSNQPSDMPFIWALAFSLVHMGYWCWKREHIETSNYQTRIRETTTRLDKILNTMPKDEAFTAMGVGTATTFGMLSVITDMAREAQSDDEKRLVAESAREQIKKALASMCRIASLWTISNARLFEANIMVVTSAEDAVNIPDAGDAFERGRYFFPDPCTLETLNLGCAKCLYLLPELAINSKDGGEVLLQPIMLPVELTSETHPGVIKGAPEAIETGRVVSIHDVKEIIDNLPANYVARQKEAIQSYYDSQENCGSILSVPLEISSGPLKNKGQIVDAVINLYRPEDGLIKSPELFQEFTRPLVLMIANLLYLYMKNKEFCHSQDTDAEA
ncbi:hypothetical protein [Planctobacterium marinum]|uniref:hypothetical protein n=1 Tax=Planctobacterium marinum TaxID=1631968 RepID=UPI001E575FEA|nr:hypothetical protein [Planctobacterium marinum]MCC2608015.1 hypothetical protein [Planctobacterium marinum]